MKKLIITLIIFAFFSLATSSKIFAHSVGQPPFFKINGVYSDLYSVQSTSLESLELPQDIAPEPVLVNQAIQFEIDTLALQVPDSIINQTQFTWEYGDGEKGTGLKNEHIYKKQGSFILKIYAKTAQDSTPQLFQSALINIIPTKEYQLPKPILKVNDWISKDPISDIAKTKFGQLLGFDATDSKGTGEIKEYIWDFGDGTSGTGPQATHVYDKDLTLVFPLLRIKDSNGFFADTYVQINNAELTTQDALAHPIGNYKGSLNNISFIRRLIPTVVVIVIFLAIILASRRKRK